MLSVITNVLSLSVGLWMTVIGFELCSCVRVQRRDIIVTTRASNAETQLLGYIVWERYLVTQNIFTWVTCVIFL